MYRPETHRLMVAPGDIVLLSAKHPCPYFQNLEAPSFYWYFSDFILQQSTDLKIRCFLAVLVPGGSLSISESHVRIKTKNKQNKQTKNPNIILFYTRLYAPMHTRVYQISWSWSVCEFSDMGKVWGQGRGAGDRTQGTGDSVRFSRCWDRQEQVFLELPRGRRYHSTLMQDFCSMLLRGQICVSPLGSTSSPPSQHGPPAPLHSLWPSLL